jgi:hypothetical protein
MCTHESKCKNDKIKGEKKKKQMNKNSTHTIQAICIKKDNAYNMTKYNLCKSCKFYLTFKN